MATAARRQAPFDPSAFATFRFVARELDEHGRVTLRYALDDRLEFIEEYQLPVDRVSTAERERVDGLLSLLHWVAGVSYFKTAVPETVVCERTGPPPPAAAKLLEALYSEGLGEFAYENRLPRLPRPVFAAANMSAGPPAADESHGAPGATPANVDGELPGRMLVPIGGGKDSIVALETVRRAGCEAVLFSVGDAPPIARTAEVAGLPHLVCRRRLDPGLAALNREGAFNGHVPVTAIVSCVALLTAALRGYGSVALANERSASTGNLVWDGVEINHQFSKSLHAERLLRAALAEIGAGVELFSVLRPASELAIARAFARLEPYHQVFTSCNTVFRLDPALRGSSWCRDCPKCRFVFLALAPFCEPAHLRAVFGVDLLDDERQFEGFALLTATGGHKPFECVGEEQESLAAIRLLAAQPRWRRHRVVERLVSEVLPRHGPAAGDPEQVLALSGEHFVPDRLMRDVVAVLGA